MKLLPKTNSAVLEILQRPDKNSSLPETKLQIEENELEEKLNSLNLEDKPKSIRALKNSEKLRTKDDETALEEELNRLNLEDQPKLVPRAPIWTGDSQNKKVSPYSVKGREKVNVSQYVSYIHSCKGVFIYSRGDEQTSPVSCYPECTQLSPCKFCCLKIAYSPDFLKFITQAFEEANKPQTNMPTATTNTREVNKSEAKTDSVKPRRPSADSGFQSDNPSPLSDAVLSPCPSVTEVKVNAQRRLLPKANMKSAQEMLRSTLNPDIKQVKWIEVLRKTEDEVFGKDKDGQTILEKLLQSDEKYITESFYAIVEQLKKNPTKCDNIIAAQSLIYDAIEDNNHPDLLLDYFTEFLSTVT